MRQLITVRNISKRVRRANLHNQSELNFDPYRDSQLSKMRVIDKGVQWEPHFAYNNITVFLHRTHDSRVYVTGNWPKVLSTQRLLLFEHLLLTVFRVEYFKNRSLVLGQSFFSHLTLLSFLLMFLWIEFGCWIGWEPLIWVTFSLVQNYIYCSLNSLIIVGP